jgi:hypothetical protein
LKKIEYLQKAECDPKEGNMSYEPVWALVLASKKPIEFMEILIKNGWEINKKWEDHASVYHGANLLNWAKGGRKDIVDWLLAHGARE